LRTLLGVLPADLGRFTSRKALGAVLCSLFLVAPASDAAGSTAAPYDAYVACGRSAEDPPSSRCFVGDRVGAFFRSNLVDAAYTVCVTFPSDRKLCAGEQAASSGVLYVNDITTSTVGPHTVTWTVNGIELTKQFVLDREPTVERKRTCGLLPGDGAYSYIETWGVTCQAGKRIAFRARKRFCSSHNDCLINPPTPITKIYKGNVRYHGWACRIKDGWELLVVRCRKGDLRFVQQSGA
jgi:hypothetical protein